MEDSGIQGSPPQQVTESLLHPWAHRCVLRTLCRTYNVEKHVTVNNRGSSVKLQTFQITSLSKSLVTISTVCFLITPHCQTPAVKLQPGKLLCCFATTLLIVHPGQHQATLRLPLKAWTTTASKSHTDNYLILSAVVWFPVWGLRQARNSNFIPPLKGWAVEHTPSSREGTERSLAVGWSLLVTQVDHVSWTHAEVSRSAPLG